MSDNGELITMSGGGSLEPVISRYTNYAEQSIEYRAGEYLVPRCLEPMANRVIFRKDSGGNTLTLPEHIVAHGSLCFHMGMGIGLNDAR